MTVYLTCFYTVCKLLQLAADGGRYLLLCSVDLLSDSSSSYRHSAGVTIVLLLLLSRSLLINLNSSRQCSEGERKCSKSKNAPNFL